jgi:peptidyl-prolyl cis-trans isomerase A (cyclophilin A)
MKEAVMNRRTLFGAALWAALIASPALAQSPAAPDMGKMVKVDLNTAAGTIVLELYPDKAPITVGNFLKYVKSKRYDGIDFYRAVRTPGAPDTGFIQGGAQGDPKRVLPPIKLEPTSQTGLHHQDGTITMARLAPNSATSDFVIMVGPNVSYMDANPAAPGDNLGYAAFGQVVDGMDVVKKILALPSEGHARNPVMKGQILDPPVKIISARVEP